MGRIQRKKTTKPKKKKKETATDTAGAHLQSEHLAAKSPDTAAEPSETSARRKSTPLQKKAQPLAAVVPSKPAPNFIVTAVQFLREVKVELKKVTWPSRKQTIGSTVVVLALVMLISFFLGVVDIGLSHLIQVVLQ